ncbi:MAG: ATP-binding protein [Thiotrichaceae bacterium]|nr:ATP-binding protein [Thiotrichaceae bacterium]
MLKKLAIFRIFNRLSLKFILVIPFIIQLIIVIGVVNWLSYSNGQATVREMLNQLRQEITSRINHEVETLLSIPPMVNHFNTLALDYNEIDVTDVDASARHYWRQIKYFPSLTYISYTNSEGNIVSAYRDFASKQLQIFLANEETQHAHQQYIADDQGNRTTLIQSVPGFDGKKRAWFKAVLAAGKPTWYPVYKYYSLDDFGVGLGSPVYDKNQNFKGMFTADLALSQISEFLQNLNLGKSGVAFIVEADNSMIASSNIQKLYITQEDGTAQRIKAGENSHPLIKASADYLQQQFRQISSINSIQHDDFTVDNKNYFLQITPLHYEGGLDWWIVVTIPQADFMQHINSNTYMTFSLSILACIIAIFIGLLTAHRVIRPILTLNNAAKALTSKQWNHVIPVQRHDELGQLTQVFNQMSQQLRILFTQIESNEMRLKQFLEAMPVSVIVLHPNSNVHYTNQQAIELLGHNIEYFTNLSSIYPTYIAGTQNPYPLERLPIFRALQGEISAVDDIEIDQEGIIIPIEMWGTPLFDEKGRILYGIAAFQNIAERKQMEKDRLRFAQEQEAKQVALRYTLEIEQKNAQLLQLNQDKNEFLGIAAHDLKNPLSGILGISELMIEDAETFSPKEINYYAEMIAEASGQMFDLISNLLDVNQIESGKVKINIEAIDINEVIQKLLQNYSERATVKNITLSFKPQTTDTTIWTDKLILRQVLDNIISNAIKYSPPNKHVCIGLTDIESSIRCAIQDEGPGFSVEDQQKLFGKFTCLTARPTAGENSTGLGLFIVKKLVETIKGRVWCKSELGHGACFYIELPKKPM